LVEFHPMVPQLLFCRLLTVTFFFLRHQRDPENVTSNPLIVFPDRLDFIFLTDILNEDYTSKVYLKCKKNAGIVAVTIETEQGEGGSLSSKIGTKFNYAKFNVDKGQVTADGGKVLETSIAVTPEMKLAFKAGKGADLCLDYVKGKFYGTATLDVLEMSNVTTSACVGLNHGLNLGADCKYSLSGSKAGLSGFNVGASYTHGPIFASVTATNKLSQYNVGLLYKVSPDLTLASSTTHSSSKMCDVLAVGGAFKAAKVGTIKAKVGSNGLVSACLVREIAPQVTLTLSGSMSASDVSTFKPGFGISM
jgi:voltage-dependent anion channel protein 2